MASTPSTRRQHDGVAVWSLTDRFSQHGLCGLGMYNKSPIIGPLWYRLEKLMREVIIAVGLGVDDLRGFEQVEDRYFEALHARHMELGTHPRDALARLARGGAAPEEPEEPPERVYDDADDAVDDIAIDGLTI